MITDRVKDREEYNIQLRKLVEMKAEKGSAEGNNPEEDSPQETNWEKKDLEQKYEKKTLTVYGVWRFCARSLQGPLFFRICSYP